MDSSDVSEGVSTGIFSSPFFVNRVSIDGKNNSSSEASGSPNQSKKSIIFECQREADIGYKINL
jgi:hypothetical protein